MLFLWIVVLRVSSRCFTRRWATIGLLRTLPRWPGLVCSCYFPASAAGWKITDCAFRSTSPMFTRIRRQRAEVRHAEGNSPPGVAWSGVIDLLFNGLSLLMLGLAVRPAAKAVRPG